MAGDAQTIVEKISAITRRERLLIGGVNGEHMEAGDQLEAITDTAQALRRASLPFAIIGGIAVGIRSEVPRATDDVDVAVATTASRTAVTAALEGAGLEPRCEYKHSLNFRHRNGEPVQIAMDSAFDQMIQRAEPLLIGGHQVPVVRTEDLIEMKERAARDPARRRSKALRDQADVALLRGDSPDPDEGW